MPIEYNKMLPEAITKCCVQSVASLTKYAMPRKPQKTKEKPLYRVDFAKRLQAARIAAGYEDHKKFAGAIGVASPTYGRWERAETEPNIYYLSRIAEATGKSLDWLLTGKGVATIHRIATA